MAVNGYLGGSDEVSLPFIAAKPRAICAYLSSDSEEHDDLYDEFDSIDIDDEGATRADSGHDLDLIKERVATSDDAASRRVVPAVEEVGYVDTLISVVKNNVSESTVGAPRRKVTVRRNTAQRKRLEWRVSGDFRYIILRASFTGSFLSS